MKVSSILVVDNGAYDIKAEYSGSDSLPRCFPNAITKAKSERKRVFIAEQLQECNDLSALFYMLPFQKGYLVNLDLQKQIWDHLLGKDVFKVKFSETGLVFTEPCFNFPSIQETLDEIFFEDYEFQALFRVNATTLSAFNYTVQNRDQSCSLVVDSGYSFTHIVPYHEGRMIKDKIMRIDVGGKALTNYLKDIISYRQLNVMDETYVVNQCKEDCCYVSADFNRDMEIASKKSSENTILKDYVLPDFCSIQRGFMRDPSSRQLAANVEQQLIRMGNERFTVPEILFHPSDIGINEMGISEAIITVVESLNENLRSHMYNNIVLTGGNCCFPGFKERLYKDIRASASVDYDVRVVLTENPRTYAWHGGNKISKKPLTDDIFVTRKEYSEHGYNICTQKFRQY